jgi:hypothetical protein
VIDALTADGRGCESNDPRKEIDTLERQIAGSAGQIDQLRNWER